MRLSVNIAHRNPTPYASVKSAAGLAPSAAPTMSSPFVHLHVQSMYSLYDGLGSPEDIISRAKELGYNSIALTDRHALYGAVEFYEAAHKAEQTYG